MPENQKEREDRAKDERAREWEGEPEGASDQETDEDELKRRALGGYGGDTGEAARWAPPVSDRNDEHKRR